MPRAPAPTIRRTQARDLYLRFHSFVSSPVLGAFPSSVVYVSGDPGYKERLSECCVRASAPNYTARVVLVLSSFSCKLPVVFTSSSCLFCFHLLFIPRFLFLTFSEYLRVIFVFFIFSTSVHTQFCILVHIKKSVHGGVQGTCRLGGRGEESEVNENHQPPSGGVTIVRFQVH